MPALPRLIVASLALALLGRPATVSAGEPAVDVGDDQGPAEPGPPASMIPPELEPPPASGVDVGEAPAEPGAEVEAEPDTRANEEAPPAARPPPKRRRPGKRKGDEPRIEAPPRQLAVAVGWAHNTVDHLPDRLVDTPKRPHGVALQLAHLWQVGGLARRWPTWLGLRVGVDVLPATAVSRQVVALDYGLVVKHGLGRPPRIRPYLGYGLGAAQAFIKTIDGSGGGPQLRLAAGVDVPLRGALLLSFEASYRIRWLPTFRQDGFEAVRWDFQTLALTAGVSFDLAPQPKPPPRRRGRG